MAASRLLAVTVVCCVLGVSSARDNGVGRLPPLGWNTWCTWSSCLQAANYSHALHDVCTEAMVKSVAQAIIDNGMQAAGYKYINLDDCWEATTRDPATGAMQADPDRFPGGTLKPLADWLHSKGFLFGMYTAAGNETCSTGGRKVPGNPDARGVPGSWGHYEQDAQTYASWGVDYVKLDWCTKYPNNGSLALKMADALNKTGRPMWLNFHCDGAYADWCPVAGNSWRIAHDHHDVWDNTATVIETLKGVAANAGPYRWNDPDFLMTGGAGCDIAEPGKRCPGQTDDEYRTEFSLWAIAAASMLVATDVRNMSDLQKEVLLNTEIIAIQQDPLAKAGGLIPQPVGSPNSDSAQVWGRPLNVKGTHAAALYNSGSSTETITVHFSSLSIPDGTRVFVRDLWQHKDVGVFTGKYSAPVPSHGTVMLKLTEHSAE